jgi:hypothetical protein
MFSHIGVRYMWRLGLHPRLGSKYCVYLATAATRGWQHWTCAVSPGLRGFIYALCPCRCVPSVNNHRHVEEAPAYRLYLLGMSAPAGFEARPGVEA